MKINDTLRAMLDSVGLGLPDLTLPDMSGLSTFIVHGGGFTVIRRL